MGACALPRREFPFLADSCDDDKHSLGAEVLDLLESSEIQNCAVFIARYYDGTHIGDKVQSLQTH